MNEQRYSTQVDLGPYQGFPQLVIPNHEQINQLSTYIEV